MNTHIEDNPSKEFYYSMLGTGELKPYIGDYVVIVDAEFKGHGKRLDDITDLIIESERADNRFIHRVPEGDEPIHEIPSTFIE